MVKRIVLLLLLIIYCVLMCPINVNADMGPKPSITIHCTNMPNTLCYLDLLVENGSAGDGFTNINNINKYNQQLINKLKAYDTDGWRSAMLNGTSRPIFGDIRCDIKDGKCTQKFSYLGVPDRFKIIIVTADNKTVVTKEIKRLAFSSTVYFDFKKAEATEHYPFLSYIFQFLLTCISTLILEGLVLLLFRFSLKANWKLFIIINITTQILLTILVFYQMVIKGGTLGAVLYYLLFEIFIFIFEAALFSEFLQEHSKKRRIYYALTANLISFITGIVIMKLF